MLQSYDTAFSKKESADYSAITTWGVFSPGDSMADAIILLNAERGRWDFPELKAVAYDTYREYNPDMVLIESQASGTPLTHELRMMGIPVVNYSPGKGQDKIARVNSVAPILESGMVYVPETRWAEELVEECAAFPSGDHDDLVDSTTQALLRFRQGGWIRSNLDDEEDQMMYRRPVDYY